MAFGKTVHTYLYNNLSISYLWINTVDNEIAIDENVLDMISVFSKLGTETLTFSAKDYSLKEIGHMKFFSRKSQVLWVHALNWLEKH